MNVNDMIEIERIVKSVNVSPRLECDLLREAIKLFHKGYTLEMIATIVNAKVTLLT